MSWTLVAPLVASEDTDSAGHLGTNYSILDLMPGPAEACTPGAPSAPGAHFAGQTFNE